MMRSTYMMWGPCPCATTPWVQVHTQTKPILLGHPYMLHPPLPTCPCTSPCSHHACHLPRPHVGALATPAMTYRQRRVVSQSTPPRQSTSRQAAAVCKCATCVITGTPKGRVSYKEVPLGFPNGALGWVQGAMGKSTAVFRLPCHLKMSLAASKPHMQCISSPILVAACPHT
jgi:hypothetical protein